MLRLVVFHVDVYAWFHGMEIRPVLQRHL